MDGWGFIIIMFCLVYLTFIFVGHVKVLYDEVNRLDIRLRNFEINKDRSLK